MKATTLKSVKLNISKHHRTGSTVHCVGGGKVEKLPYRLDIVSYKEDTGVYLLHIDAANQEITDTYHESQEDAMTQAEWEFGVKTEDWI